MNPSSELILNTDGSVYHLNLLPEDIGDTIFFVGDPDRVKDVSKHFDRIETKKQKREFVTHTGYIGVKKYSVISTGIGTDNIDIVINELDALVNIDLKSKQVLPNLKQLTFIRIGTSGALQKHIEINSLLLSKAAIGMEGLQHFYQYAYTSNEEKLQKAFSEYLNQNQIALLQPYAVFSGSELINQIPSDYIGITITNGGFYGPQGRQVRALPKSKNLLDVYAAFQSEFGMITNLEMETAGIYGLSNLLGHRAISANVIIANRALNQFSNSPQDAVEKSIIRVLESL
jgi:uridine phosphorylase